MTCIQSERNFQVEFIDLYSIGTKLYVEFNDLYYIGTKGQAEVSDLY